MKPLIEIKNVCKRFGGVVAANDICLNIMPGEVRGLIGPNGSGKTTLLNLINGIYQVDSGNIIFNGEDITKAPSHKRARQGIGRTFQTPRFLKRSTIEDNLLLGKDLADQLGFANSFFGKKGTDFKNELEILMDVAGFDFNQDDDIGSLPFGKQKLLEIVRAMLTSPKLLLLDEPAAGTNSSEYANIVNFINLASQRGIAVLLIEHVMELVMNVCHNITVLSFGKVIADGTPEEVRSSEAVIEAYLGRAGNA